MNTKEIHKGYLGNTKVNSLYQGSDLVWAKYFHNQYLIVGGFTGYFPNTNLYEDKKDTILFNRTYNGTTYDSPPFDDAINNIVATIDNSTQIDPEFSVMKINRKNSNVNQVDYVQFPLYNIEPGKTMEMSFWYYGTYGTSINIYSLDVETYVERWDVSTNAYITNNSKDCIIPVTTNTWQYIKVRARNTHATLNKRGIQWLVLHYNQTTATLSNTQYWKITCVKHWYVETVTKNKIMRLNYDYSVDNTFFNNTGLNNGAIWDVQYDEINKKIYGVGDPTLNGVGIVRFNVDGTIDSNFNVGTGFNFRVRCLELDKVNNKIYCGGECTTYNGTTINRICRINSNGSLDTTFNSGGSNFNSTVTNIKLYNNKLYCFGTFTTYNGTTRNRIVCLNTNGTIDNSFNYSTGFNNTIYNAQIDKTNNKIYCGGRFTTYNTTTKNKIARLNIDGTLDATYNSGGSEFNNDVYGITIDEINSKIYCIGLFTTYNGTTKNRLIRLNFNGSIDASFNIGTGLDMQGYGNNGILVDNEFNKIYVIGNHRIYNGQPQIRIVRLNMDGSLDNLFPLGLNSSGQSIIKYTK